MMRKTFILILACVCLALNANAQRGSGRLSLGAGLLYKNGMDVTLAYEHEVNYRHAWEFFANGYLQWTECASCGHVCLTSRVSHGDATTTEICVSGRQRAAIQTSSLPVCISATSITMCCAPAGRYSGR